MNKLKLLKKVIKISAVLLLMLGFAANRSMADAASEARRLARCMSRFDKKVVEKGNRADLIEALKKLNIKLQKAKFDNSFGKDTDLDSAANIVEELLGTSVDSSDSDGDGLSDGDELNEKLDPNDDDTDDDGISDGSDDTNEAEDGKLEFKGTLTSLTDTSATVGTMVFVINSNTVFKKNPAEGDFVEVKYYVASDGQTNVATRIKKEDNSSNDGGDDNSSSSSGNDDSSSSSSSGGDDSGSSSSSGDDN